MSDVFLLASRWGRSVQHSHRKHPGCGEAGGGVIQDEKCKEPTLQLPQTLWCVLNICLRSLLEEFYILLLLLLSFLQMFQVIQPERALYIQANNCVEARDWIDILTKVSQCNRKRLSTYHPSAYLNGHWLCCKLSADAAPGCTPCTGYEREAVWFNPGSLFSIRFALSYFSMFPLFAAASQQTFSWTWMETERLRGFTPCSAHTWPNWSRCKVRAWWVFLHFCEEPGVFFVLILTLLPGLLPCRGLWQ